MSDRKKLEEAILFYLLTQDETTALSNALYDALLTATQASYRWVAQIFGVPSEWIPDAALQEQLHTLAEERASGITETYNEDIRQAGTILLDAYETANGTIDGAASSVLDGLDSYASDRADWKSTQIADYETSEGQQLGTETAFDDFDSGDLEATTLPEEMWIGVMPDTAALDDVCMDWAGEMVPYENRDDLPFFPAHTNCPHYLVPIHLGEY